MRARVDMDEAEHPAEIVERQYDRAFFDALKSQFPFCMAISDLENRIRHFGRIYIALRRSEDNEGLLRAVNCKGLSLKAQTDRFLKALETSGDRADIVMMLELAAHNLNEPPPKAEFSELTDHEKRGGEPYLRELQRLLKILVAAADLQATYIGVRRGPKINSGLEFVVRRTADMFLEELQRPFTIDHHKPFKPTEAFLFIRAIIDPLDDVTDDSVVSTMRADRARRLRLNKRPNK